MCISNAEAKQNFIVHIQYKQLWLLHYVTAVVQCFLVYFPTSIRLETSVHTGYHARLVPVAVGVVKEEHHTY